MISTDGFNSSLFLNFFFSVFPLLIEDYRRVEKLVIKIIHTKARMKFLKKCLDEKVVPASMNWLWKLNKDVPFPVEAISQLRLSIKKLQCDVDTYYFNLRRNRRNLRSKVNDASYWSKIQQIINNVRDYQRDKKEHVLSIKLGNLIKSSPWTRYSKPNNVFNLSNYQVSLEQKQLLSYGLNFALPHESKHLIDYVETLEKHQHDSNKAGYNFIFMNLNSIFNNLKENQFDYLPRRFHHALNDLKRNNSIRISKADKGGKIVIMDFSEYTTKMYSMLSDKSVYKKLKVDPLKNMQSNFNFKLKEIMYSYKCQSLKTFISRLPSLPYLYGLPKIHKKNVPMRPIISNCGSPSYNLSKWLAKQLSPVLGSFSKAHLRHNQDLLDFLRSIKPGEDRFISFDVVSLFTNVPVKPTLDFLQRKLLSLNLKFDVPVECLIDLVDLCLDQSCFQFENDFYEQIFGTSMGNPLSPIISCLFLEYLETEKFPLYKGIKPTFWKRYIDDALCLVPPNFDLEKFLKFLNSLYPTIKFTFEWEHENKIAFLDVLIHRSAEFLKFSVYRKPTNAENYLHFFSFSALQIKLGIAQSLFLRAFRVCDKEFLDLEIEHVKKVLTTVAYPDWVLNKALFKARKTHFRTLFKKNNQYKKNEIEASKLIVVPFTPILNNVQSSLGVHSTKIVFSYKNKMQTNLTKNKPKSKILKGVYEIPCGDCSKKYIGETGRDLQKDRIKEHQNDIRNRKVESGVAQHANIQNHEFKFKDAKIIFPCSRPQKRKIIESALIQHYEDEGLSCNLNSGFSPHNVLLSHYIRQVVKL